MLYVMCLLGLMLVGLFLYAYFLQEWAIEEGLVKLDKLERVGNDSKKI